VAIVETQYGKVEGQLIDGLQAFLDIPFAAPPTGELRWSAPVDPTPWSGVRSSSDWGRQAWQPVMEGMGPLGFAFNARAAASYNEDCLNLNVWSPGLDNRKRPVLVWIHGGGFSGGTGATPMYDGSNLARRGDAVVVTINYRLGALGFLNLKEITGGRIDATGNEGLLDQVKALQWVSDNIEGFGGDPGRVTIFGESAGGMSVGALLAFEPAKGLFSAAIPQSGACNTAQSVTRAAEVSQALVEAVGLSVNSSVDEFYALAPDRLVEAGMVAGATMGGAMIFQPCVDGSQLAQMPIDAVKEGAADDIAILSGATRDEWRLFTAMPGFNVELTDDSLSAALAESIDEPATVIDTYREARKARGESITANDLHAAIETDRIFRIPSIRLGEALADRGKPGYQYMFTWPSPWGDGDLGSPHAIDIGFVFGTHSSTEGGGEFFGEGEQADALSEQVQDVWLAFASTGRPDTPALSDWQPYTREQRSTGIFDSPVSVMNDPASPERAVWDRVDARLGGL
jgi:para-nitrobenzyl esterase